MTLDSHALRMVLLGALAALGLYFTVVFATGLRRVASGNDTRVRPSFRELATGFVTLFFDTLGIGSFATTTAIFSARRLVPDELIPGTLNVGPTTERVLAAFGSIEVVPEAAGALIPMIAASALGAWLGSGVVAALPRHRIRLGMGTALVVAAFLMFMTQLGLLPPGADALGLSWPCLG